MYRFDRPPLLDKAVCHIVQQFRMCWPLSQLTEVASARYESGAKVMLPDPIDHHPRRQRVLWIGNRFSQLQSPATFRKWNRISFTNGREKRPPCLVPLRFLVASNINLYIRRLGHVFDGPEERILLR